MAARKVALILWVVLFAFLIITAIAGFSPSYILLVLLIAYVVMFQLGSRIRKR